MLKNKVLIAILIILITICSFNLNSYATMSDTTNIEPQQLEISVNKYAKGDKTTSIEINKVVVGQTLQLYAFLKQGKSEENSENQSILNWYVKEIDLDGLTWSSSDSSIATVDNDGKVTGIKNGYVTITASISSGYTATKQIEVINVSDTGEPWLSVIDKQESFFLGRPVLVGSLKIFYIELKNVPDTEKDNIKITIGDSSIAKVQDIKIDNSRICVEVEGLKEGSSRIQATLNYEGKTYFASRTFSVYNSLFKLNILSNLNNNSIPQNSTDQLEAILYYYDGTRVEDSPDQTYTIEWSSSNENVVKIDKNGWITPIKEGEAVITAKANLEDEIITETYNIKIIKADDTKEKGILIEPLADGSNGFMAVDEINVFFTRLQNIPVRERENVKITIEDTSVAEIEDRYFYNIDNQYYIVVHVRGLKGGNTKITASLTYDGKTYTDSYDIKVEPAEKVIENPTKIPNNFQGEKLPQTGLNEVSVVLLIIVIGISIFTYIKYRKYKNI